MKLELEYSIPKLDLLFSLYLSVFFLLWVCFENTKKAIRIILIDLIYKTRHIACADVAVAVAIDRPTHYEMLSLWNYQYYRNCLKYILVVSIKKKRRSIKQDDTTEFESNGYGKKNGVKRDTNECMCMHVMRYIIIFFLFFLQWKQRKKKNCKKRKYKS